MGASDISPAGVVFIANFEGYEPDWYDDGTGTQTIGFGHTGPLPRGLGPPLARARALELLHSDLRSYVAAVRAGARVSLSPSQFDALTSFAYNLGPGAGGLADLLPQVNRRDFAGAAALMLQYDHAGGQQLPGLTRRRQAEAALLRQSAPAPPGPRPHTSADEREQLAAGIVHFYNRYGLHGRPTADQARRNTTEFVQASLAGQRLLGISRKKLGHQNTGQLIGWLERPGAYWARRPGAFYRHRQELARRRRPATVYVFPVDGPITEQRTDRGQDMKTRPGAGIRSPGAGVVTAVPPASAISSLGQIVVQLDHPYRGWRDWYVFHLDNCYVHAGQRVKAGELLARSSSSPPGDEGDPGHIEAGWAIDSLGDIQPATDDTHYTRSGQDSHDFLHQLDPHRIGRDAIHA